MQPVNIGIAGLGTVGAGTVNVLVRNAGEISRRAGRDINVTHAAVRDLSRTRDCDTTGLCLGDDPFALAGNDAIDVLVETIGGTDVAREVVLKAIASGKHVVTANKALIAIHGNEIFSAAQRQGTIVAFEAAVAGGIPVIKSIREGLAGNRIEWLAGIINGTCNYILTEMRDHGSDFAAVLKQAQALGYAEADPDFDVGGIDAAHKLTILASIAFGIPLQFERVYCEGISHITPDDLRYADEMDMQIKHLGIARGTDYGIELRVHPTLLPKKRLLANVDGVMNAIQIYGDAVGSTLHCGAGAGAEPTASAVVADLVDVVRALTTDPGNRVPHLAFQPGLLADVPVLAMEQTETAYYLRLAVLNRPGVLAEITRILGDSNISIEAILQKGSGKHEQVLPVIIVTQQTREAGINEALMKIERLDSVKAPVVRIRMEQFA
ncbi:MAG: homoserine dehydrogenase [Arenicellales bacterium WSBS_2016_MAG_OTU3]